MGLEFPSGAGRGPLFPGSGARQLAAGLIALCAAGAAALCAQAPYDRVEIVTLREGERVTLSAMLGRR